MTGIEYAEMIYGDLERVRLGMDILFEGENCHERDNREDKKQN